MFTCHYAHRKINRVEGLAIAGTLIINVLSVRPDHHGQRNQTFIITAEGGNQRSTHQYIHITYTRTYIFIYI